MAGMSSSCVPKRRQLSLDSTDPFNGVYMEWWKQKAQNALCVFELSECLLHPHPACLEKKCTTEQKAPVPKTCG